jgi:predicted dehydrogenase
MAAGKDYFTDKTPFTSLEQLAEARATVAATGRKYMVYYCERLHVESAIVAGELTAGVRDLARVQWDDATQPQRVHLDAGVAVHAHTSLNDLGGGMASYHAAMAAHQGYGAVAKRS